MAGDTRKGRTMASDNGRPIRIAAVGDVHFDGTKGSLVDTFSTVDRDADILVLCGDLTTHGTPDQMRGLVDELGGVSIPIVAVLGNHDHEAGETEEATRILCDAGLEVLDGDYTVVEGVGFAGIKGFAGGFDRGALSPFGERIMKDFVQEALNESLKLETALRSLATPLKVAVLHYAPIAATVHGEPEVIYPFLGSSRLVQPIDTLDATVVFHGHAHHGSPEGQTPGGVPVFNVSQPLLRDSGRPYLLWEGRAPDRRRRGESSPAEEESPQAYRSRKRTSAASSG